MTNFLIVMTDQLRPDHVGFGGNDIVRTPNLDALAATGAVFEQTVVAAPVCAPNRASLMTGRNPSAHGTRINGITLDPDANTFARVLRRHGWQTAAVGKLHFQNMGFDKSWLEGRIDASAEGDAADRLREPGWDMHEDMNRHRRERVQFPPDYYGFDRVDVVSGHSDYATGHYFQWALERGVNLDESRGRERSTEVYGGWRQVYRSALPEELYPTAYVTERSIARLEEMAAIGDPFLLLASYPDPHHPFTPPGRYYGMYDPDDMDLPRTFDDPHDNAPPHTRTLIENRGTPHEDPTYTWAPTEDQLRHSLAAEYGMIAMIDDGVGQILRRLDELGLRESTVVIFTSDHGDMFGDHGLLLKGYAHYRGATHVPLVVAAPGILPSRIEGLAGTIDIAPTILELAGCPHYNGIQGHSLVPLLTGEMESIRSQVLIEEDTIDAIDGFDTPPRIRSLVTPEARLTLYVGTPHGELFDLAADPDELVNVFGKREGAALQAEMTQKLAAALVEHDDTGTAPTDSA